MGRHYHHYYQEEEDEKALDELCQWWKEGDDGRSMDVCVVFKRGAWTVHCQERFIRTFASQEEMETRMHDTHTLPSLFFAR